jgi:hypothetical protein
MRAAAPGSVDGFNRMARDASSGALEEARRMARAALLGTLPGAAIVIAWIELIHRICL